MVASSRACCARWSVASLLLLAAATLHRCTAAPYPAHAVRPSFVAVGDGLTESAFSTENGPGWGLLLQMKYVRKADIINRGFGGFYTTWLVDYMLPQLFGAAHPTLAILFLGLKDSLTPAAAGAKYISPARFGDNVRAIVSAARDAGVTNFLIVTPPPVCEICKAGKPRPWDREMNHTALYRAELASIVNTTPGAALVDIFTAWPAADPSWHVRYLLPDWLHLNAAGNAALADALLAAIRKYMPELSPESIPLNWPLMDAISRDDPAAAFNAVVGVAQAGGQGAAAAALLEAGAVGGGAAVSGAESDSSCRRRSLLAVAGGAAVAWQLGME